MSIVSLQLYPIAVLALIIWGAKASWRETAADYLSVDQTKMMQGVLCICVVLHHVTQEISSYGSRNVGPITWFSDIGFLFTGIFFFISGYGLVTNLLHRPDYLKHFIPKRLGAVLIPFWFVNLLLVMAGIFIFGDHKTTLRGVMEVFGLRLVNSNGWYIVEIVLFYLMFYLLCYCIKNKDVALVLLSVFALAIIRYAFFTGHDPTGQNATWFRGEWWYNATIMFVVGLWYARFRDRIDALLERGYKVILPLVAVLTVASMYASRYVLGRYGYYHEQLAFGHRDALITLLVQAISCVIFTLLIVLLNMRITIGNPVLRYLSKISMTLFLVHGFFVHRVFAEAHMSDFLRYAAILATGIACASIVAPVTRFLSKQAIEYLTYEKPKNDTLEAAILEKKVAKRKRQQKAALVALLMVLAVYVGYLTLFRDMIRQKEYQEEDALLSAAQVGDVVTFGRFDQTYRWPGKERMNWIVLQDGGDKLCLVSQQGIEGSSYNKKHEAVSWKESDLHARLNSDEFATMFSAYELERLETVDGDLITLLTPTQAEKLFENQEARELVITAVAIQHRTNINELSKDNNWDMKGYRSSWWWLRGDTPAASIYAPIVTVDGEISLEEKEVNRPRGAIRPVIWVKK